MYLMCGPGQLFFQCGPETAKDWTLRSRTCSTPHLTMGYDIDFFPHTYAAHFLWAVIPLSVVFSQEPESMEKPLPGILPHN